LSSASGSRTRSVWPLVSVPFGLAGRVAGSKRLLPSRLIAKRSCSMASDPNVTSVSSAVPDAVAGSPQLHPACATPTTNASRVARRTVLRFVRSIGIAGS